MFRDSKVSLISACIAGSCFSVWGSVPGAIASDVPMIGIPISAFAPSAEVEDDICPEGTRVIEELAR